MYYDDSEVKKIVDSEYDLINNYLSAMIKRAESKQEFDQFAFGVLNHTYKIIDTYRNSDYYKNLPRVKNYNYNCPPVS